MDDTAIFRAPVKIGRDRGEIRVHAQEVYAPADPTQNAFRPGRAANAGDTGSGVKGYIALQRFVVERL